MPYWFQFKKNLIFETEIEIPAGRSVATPEMLSIKRPGYSFIASYLNSAGKLLYRNEIVMNDVELKPENFIQWNKDIEQLSNFYNQQIVFTQKN